MIISILHHIKTAVVILETTKIIFHDNMLEKCDKVMENTTKFNVLKCVTCLYVDLQSIFCVKRQT